MRTSWRDFEHYNIDTTDAFEQLSRAMFCYEFNNKDLTLICSPNNPGIESEPILFKGEKYGFQAKYVNDLNTGYKELKNSATTTIKYYIGKIDTFVFYCNLDMTITSKRYKDIEKILTDAKIRLLPITNNSILQKLMLDDYINIKNCFFKKNILRDEWFDDNLKQSIDDLGGRYNCEFHVKTEMEDKIYPIFKTKKYCDKFLNDYEKKLKKIKRNSPRIPLEYFDKNQFYTKIEELLKQLFMQDSTAYVEINNIANKSIESINKYLNNEEIDKNDAYYIRELINSISEFCFLENESLMVQFKRFVLLEGDAGIGKSHLLGKLALNAAEEGYKNIFLLGHKFNFDQSPWSHIKEMLSLPTDLSESDFLNELDFYGEMKGKRVVIIIDAINECYNHSIWKDYLNAFINNISKKKNLAFVFSIRTTFLDNIISDTVQQKIKKREILKIVHSGFQELLDEATLKFFNYYKVKPSLNNLLELELTNPLFLKNFCEVAKENENFFQQGYKNFYDVFDKYTEIVDKKLKEKTSYLQPNNIVKEILLLIADYIYNIGESITISQKELENILVSYSNKQEIIDFLCKSNLIYYYLHDNTPYYYFGYEKYLELIISNLIIKKHDNIDDLIIEIKEKLFETGKYNLVKRYYANNVFSILCILTVEKYNFELIEIVTDLGVDNYAVNKIKGAYINDYAIRKNENIDLEYVFDFLNKEQKKSLIDNFYKVLIKCSLNKNNPLNANLFHKLHINKPLNEIDFCWTIRCTEEYSQRGINNKFFFYVEDAIINLKEYDSFLLSIMLLWNSSTTNLKLRDKCRFLLTKCFFDNPKIHLEIFQLFKEVKDPYIMEVLLGSLYGSIVNYSYSKLEIKELCNEIYVTIFDKKEVYLNILVRDHSKMILDFSANILKVDFNLEKIKLPFKSNKIVNIPSDEFIIKLKNDKDGNYTWNGTKQIISSLTPNAGNFSMLYGDFGRYVFQRYIEKFKNVKIEDMFKYAIKLIMKKYKYKEEYFQEFDRQNNTHGRGPRPNDYVERIGKKYEWLALYEITAILSDHYKVTDWNDNEHDYISASNLEIRAFDYSVLDYNIEILKYDFDVYKPNLEIDPTEWTKTFDDLPQTEKLLKHVDENNVTWILLNKLYNWDYGSYEEAKYATFTHLHAYFVVNENYDNVIKYLSKKDFGDHITPHVPSYDAFYLKEFFNSTVLENKKLIEEKYTLNEYTRHEEIEEVDSETIENYRDSLSVVFDDHKNIDIEAIIETLKTKSKYINEEKIIGELIFACNEYGFNNNEDIYKLERAIYIPNKNIMERFGLIHNTLNGEYINSEKMVVFKNINTISGNGCYIREDILNQFLNEKNLSMFWTTLCDKIYSNEETLGVDKNIYSNRKSELVYYKDNKIIKVVSLFNTKGELV